MSTAVRLLVNEPSCEKRELEESIKREQQEEVENIFQTSRSRAERC